MAIIVNCYAVPLVSLRRWNFSCYLNVSYPNDSYNSAFNISCLTIQNWQQSRESTAGIVQENSDWHCHLLFVESRIVLTKYSACNLLKYVLILDSFILLYSVDDYTLVFLETRTAIDATHWIIQRSNRRHIQDSQKHMIVMKTKASK